VRIRQLTSILLLATVAWAVLKISKSSASSNIGCHTIKLKYGSSEFGPPDPWDPPPFIKISPEGKREFEGVTYGEDELPPDLARQILMQPISYRGVSLMINRDTPFQKVVDFLDQFKTISDRVLIESKNKWGVTGDPVHPHLYYFSDTGRPLYLKKIPAPRVEIHDYPPPPPV